MKKKVIIVLLSLLVIGISIFTFIEIKQNHASNNSITQNSNKNINSTVIPTPDLVPIKAKPLDSYTDSELIDLLDTLTNNLKNLFINSVNPDQNLSGNYHLLKAPYQTKEAFTTALGNYLSNDVISKLQFKTENNNTYIKFPDHITQNDLINTSIKFTNIKSKEIKNGALVVVSHVNITYKGISIAKNLTTEFIDSDGYIKLNTNPLDINLGF